MERVTIDMKDSMLDKLVTALDGSYPDMNKKERQDFEDYKQEIKEKQEILEVSVRNMPFKSSPDFILKKVEDIEEASNCRNALLDDLYYKMGIKDGVRMMIECLKPEY